jgi:hypothetical protein
MVNQSDDVISNPDDAELWLSSLDDYFFNERLPILLELPGELSEDDLNALAQGYSLPSSFTNNAFLNDWNILEPNSWLTFHAHDSKSSDKVWGKLVENYGGNFWGGAGNSLIDIAINDFSDNFNKDLLITYQFCHLLPSWLIHSYPIW